MKNLIKEGEKYLFNTYKHYDVVFESAENGCLIDTEGKAYIDFGSGIAVNSLGYDDNGFKAALKGQIDKFLHCSNLYYNALQIELAKKLSTVSGYDKVFFANSGTEANEAALKLARMYGRGRAKFISFKNSFHGRTTGALSLTGQDKYKKGFGSLIENVVFAEYNNFKSIEKLVDDDVCAIILEPIQGEGGIIEAELEFMQKIRSLCDKKDIMLIFDEVQTGIGRTGELFCHEHYGVRPDVLTLAKGLGSGVPIGAVLANDKFAKVFTPATHGTTFGGNPLACAAGLYVINKVSNEKFLKDVRQKGEYLRQKLETLGKTVKGKGLMLGIEVSEKPADIVQKALEQGLLVLSAGENVIRLVPPLTIEKNTIDKGFEILKEILK